METTQQEIDSVLLPDYLTEQQKTAITARGGSILLSASAGSGKTFVLASRAVYQMARREHPIRADRLLIVTFTRAAALEMRKRIFAYFDSLLLRFPTDPLLLKQKLFLERASIMTIDAFCTDLLKEHFDKANLSPNFRIAEENEIYSLLDDTITEILEESCSQNREEYQRLAGYFGLKGDAALKRSILHIYQYACKQPFPLIWLKNAFENFWLEDSVEESAFTQPILQYIQSAITHILSLYRQGREFAADFPVLYARQESYFEKSIQALTLLRQEVENVSWNQLRLCVSQFVFPRKKGGKKPENYEEEAAEILEKMFLLPARKLLKEINQNYLSISAEDFFTDREAQRPIMKRLYEMVCDFYQRIHQTMFQRGILDFSTIEITALKVILDEHEDKTALGKQLSHQYDEIMVDECQDVSALQDKLLTAISHNRENLFMVGDVKQSIYRFRQASPQLFLEKLEAFAPIQQGTFPAKISLNTNFRSNSEVTGTVNYLFSQMMNKDFGGIAYHDEEKLHSSIGLSLEEGSSELHLLKGSSKSSDRIEMEAAYVAQMIERMCTEGFAVRDKNGKTRPCTPGDFAILLRSSKGKAEIYAQKLMERGVNAWTESANGYFKAREVSLMLDFLRVIDNPLLDVSMLAVLLSGLFDFSPDDLARLRLIDANMPLFLCLQQDVSERSQRFLKILEYFRQESCLLSVEKLIRKIFDETLFITLFSTMESSDQKIANLYLLLHYAKTYEDSSKDGLTGFLSYIDRVQQLKQDFKTANVMNENDNAVHIMTIHKSKGLEFPVVIIADTASKFNLQDLKSPICFSRSGIAAKHTIEKHLTRFATLPYLSAQLSEREEQLSEELRLLYVAMTRAMEKLIFICCTKEPIDLCSRMALLLEDDRKLAPFHLLRTNSIAEWIITGFLRHPSLDEFRRCVGLQRVLHFQDQSEQASFHAVILHDWQESAHQQPPVERKNPLPLMQEKLIKQLSYEYPYWQITKIPAKLSVSQITKNSGSSSCQFHTPHFDKEDKLTGAERGTANHQFIQYADFSLARENLQEEVSRLYQLEFLDDRQFEALDLEGLNAFFHSSLMERILKADSYQKELSFFCEIDAELLYEKVKGEKILIQGIVDCILEEDGMLTIVDYKTDRLLEADLVERYKAQLNFYKRALSDVYHRPIASCILYSLYLKKEIVLN